MAEDRRALFQAFGMAAAISLGLHLLQPWGRYALYPFSLLATWAHELGHGLTAEALGGEFRHLELYSNLGGVAVHSGVAALFRPFVSMGGLLGPAIAGGAIIYLSARSVRAARITLVVLGATVALSWLLWVRNVFGFFAAGGLTALLLGVAYKASPRIQVGAIQLCGIQLCLGSLSSFDYMFSKGFVRNGQPMASDTEIMAQGWLLPFWFWGGVIAALSVTIMFGAFYGAWIKPLRKKGVGRTPGET